MANHRKRYLTNLILLFAFCIAVQSQSNAPSAKEVPAQQQSAPASQSSSQDQQQDKPPAEEKPRKVYESSTVLKAITRLVVVDVVATNGKGVPVPDLTVENFTVLEEGKQQKIRIFNFQHPAPAPASEAAISASLILPPNVFSNIPKVNINNTLNIVLLDALNTTRTNQAYVRDQMIKYLEKMPTEEPIAVYTLTQKLRLLQDFTTDPKLLKAVVQNWKGHTSPVLENATGGDPMPLFAPGVFESMPQQIQQALENFEIETTNFQTDLRVRYTLDALSAIARSVAGYPGRKNLIWLSEAFPLDIGPTMNVDGNGFSNMDTRNYSTDIAQTADALMNAQIAIYPVDARGLVGSSFFSASNSGTDKFGRSVTRGGRMAQTMTNESTALFSAHGTMQDLAERTGGKAFYNRNDIDAAIGHSIDDGSTYYTLAYYPENKNWDGRFRKITVKLNRSGVKVRHRLGYFASDLKGGLDPKQRDAAFVDALDLDYPIATGLLFEAGVVQPSAKTQNKVMVNFAVDPHALSFEKKDDGLQHANVNCAVHIYSEKGKSIRTELSGINASLKPDTFAKVMQGTFPCQAKFDLGPGTYFLRLGVIDASTGLIGSTNAKVTVLPPAAESAATTPEEKKQ